MFLQTIMEQLINI